jgi:hypothetical protein
MFDDFVEIILNLTSGAESGGEDIATDSMRVQRKKSLKEKFLLRRKVKTSTTISEAWDRNAAEI